MPNYTFVCKDNHENLFYSSFDHAPPLGHYILCNLCTKPAYRWLSSPNFVGGLKFSGFESLKMPLGQDFTSSKEVDKFLKTKNIGFAGESKNGRNRSKPS